MNSHPPGLSLFTATLLISAVLDSSQAMEVHVGTSENGAKSSTLMEVVQDNCIPRIHSFVVSGGLQGHLCSRDESLEC